MKEASTMALGYEDREQNIYKLKMLESTEEVSTTKWLNTNDQKNLEEYRQEDTSKK